MHLAQCIDVYVGRSFLRLKVVCYAEAAVVMSRTLFTLVRCLRGVFCLQMFPVLGRVTAVSRFRGGVCDRKSEVSLKNSWEIGMVGGARWILKIGGRWEVSPQKQVGDGMLRFLSHTPV